MSDAATLDDPLARAAHHAQRYLESLDRRPVAATVSRHTLLDRFAGPLPQHGHPAAAVVDELAAAADGGQIGNASGRFFAWVIGGAVPASIGADWLATAWDQAAVIYATSPVSSVVEEVAGHWLLELLRLPASASFGLTTGCQMAHFTALAAAREHQLSRAGWDVNARGMAGGPPIRVIVSEIRHVSLDRALRYLGIGSDQLVVLPSNAEGTIGDDDLAHALAASRGPAIVALNAGDLNTAAFDRFSTLVPIAHAHGAWVHVDAAFGLFARVTPRFDALTAGMDLADSWATDCHKWLNVPQDVGFVAVRHREAHRRAMTIHDSYFVDEVDARDAIDWTPEWSRRARGFSVYAALRELGRDGVVELIERNCDVCAELLRRLAEIPRVEVVAPARLNQGLVRFLDGRRGASAADHDACTDRVIDLINRSGEAMFGPATWRGQRVMRVCVVNWRTGQRDVDRTVAAVAAAVQQA